MLACCHGFTHDSDEIERMTGRRFNDENLVLRALTTAGVHLDDWDGNRKLAQFGQSLIQSILFMCGFGVLATRGHINGFRCDLSSRKHRAAVARRVDLHKHIVYSEERDIDSPKVICKAVSAIVAAAFIDAGGKDLDVSFRVMLRLGVFVETGKAVNPKSLECKTTPVIGDITSLASLLSIGSPQSQTLHETPQDFTYPSDSFDMDAYLEQPLMSEAERHRSAQMQQETAPMEDVCWHTDSTASASTSADPMSLNAIEKAASPEIQAIAYTSQESIGMSGLSAPPPAESALTISKRNKQNRRDTSAVQPLAEGTSSPTRTGKGVPRKGEIELLRRLSTCSASLHSIIVFRRILNDWRSSDRASGTTGCVPSSPSDLYDHIQRLDQNVAHNQFIRRYSILKLYKVSGGPETPKSTGFVVSGPSSSPHAAAAIAKSGNPNSRAEANVTARMMESTFPLMSQNDREYPETRRLMNIYRRLGFRLYLLELRFGPGIIGLLPWVDQSGEVGRGISDTVLLAPTDVEYRRLVKDLDASKGDLLRRLAADVYPAVISVTEGQEVQAREFNFEKESYYIMVD